MEKRIYYTIYEKEKILLSSKNLFSSETIHHNGSFTNVDEVHNNTGTMIIRGFNQEGGKVTGNIGNLVVESRQNTSTTTGSSIGVSLGGKPKITKVTPDTYKNYLEIIKGLYDVK